MIELLHTSDSHEFADGMKDVLAVAEYYNLPLVHTGDITATNFSGDISYASPEKMLFCIGNHDVWVPGTADYTDQQQLYNKYYAPYAKQRGTVQTAPDTWWYKDLQGVRIVSTDSVCEGEVLSRELKWLDAVMAVDMPIIVLSHMAPRTLVPKKCSFSDMNYYAKYFEWDPGMQKYKATVNALAEVIAKYKANVQIELCGHEHADMVGDNVGWLVCAISSVVIDPDNDLYRSSDALTSRCVCNLVRLNPYESVEIYRLGAMDRANGCTERMISYDLRNKKFGEVLSW